MRARQKRTCFCSALGWRPAGPWLQATASQSLGAACPVARGWLRTQPDSVPFQPLAFTRLLRAQSRFSTQGGRGGPHPAQPASPHRWGEGPDEPARADALSHVSGEDGSFRGSPGSGKSPRTPTQLITKMQEHCRTLNCAPGFTCWSPTHSGMVFALGLWEAIRVRRGRESGTPRWDPWLSKKRRRDQSPLSATRGQGKKAAVCKAGGGASWGRSSAAPGSAASASRLRETVRVAETALLRSLVQQSALTETNTTAASSQPPSNTVTLGLCPSVPSLHGYTPSSHTGASTEPPCLPAEEAAS